ncbi:hypothetical protein GCM10011613_25420 [Cellvibrio zantedeschiae]|uniref:DGQHR domain-containing protein n=1 Tax=Cellvibrio zantedeschiae TaxID=1237077 RepID=A0ABQ3B5R3_9GAMM|nr:DGQHR domain-containing protein [Cellvibrio zantedeschiae]GGY79479.1 hypothetical protein GCM10011613_25420 [Cellvibrio zantedeschiae]
MAKITMSVNLITQADHKFYSGTLETDVIASTCTTNPRESDPVKGFQRKLDPKRAQDIANYIHAGGTIPSSIILSAQAQANFVYNSRNRSVTFDVEPNAFLILDGQHRVYGFSIIAKKYPSIKYRIPVIIFTDLTVMQEARLFIDINTLQKPVPKELLLDIRALAKQEGKEEELLNELFGLFESQNDSFLKNKLSRYEKKKGKISKVTFYDSLKQIIREFQITDTERLYKVINTYLNAANDIATNKNISLIDEITKATVFKILIAHSKTIISVITDNRPEDVTKISAFKKQLEKSLANSLDDVLTSTSYTKTVDSLDKKLFKVKNVVI